MHRSANEASAVGAVRKLATLQANYAAERPTRGFACKLSQLEAVDHGRDELGDQIFATGERTGYKFTLIGCESNAHAPIAHYQLTAVPLTPGTSGVHAFCTDQNDVIWYEETGSAATCLSSR